MKEGGKKAMERDSKSEGERGTEGGKIEGRVRGRIIVRHERYLYLYFEGGVG